MGNKIPRGVFEIHLYSIAYPRTDSLFGERLSVLINGELLQSGAKSDIFDTPLTEGVAR